MGLRNGHHPSDGDGAGARRSLRHLLGSPESRVWATWDEVQCYLAQLCISDLLRSPGEDLEGTQGDDPEQSA